MANRIGKATFAPLAGQETIFLPLAGETCEVLHRWYDGGTEDEVADRLAGSRVHYVAVRRGSGLVQVWLLGVMAVDGVAEPLVSGLEQCRAFWRTNH